MKLQIRSYSHAVGEFNYHIQITPAYRREVMEDEKVDRLVKAYVTSKLDELKVRVVTRRGGKEHLHIFVADCKNIAPSEMIRQLKGFSSRMLRKNHWNLFRHLLWGDKFWSEGYFCRSIGSTTTEAVEYYIEHSQDKHWVDYEDYQRTLDL
jgi:putative transposase